MLIFSVRIENLFRKKFRTFLFATFSQILKQTAQRRPVCSAVLGYTELEGTQFVSLENTALGTGEMCCGVQENCVVASNA